MLWPRRGRRRASRSLRLGLDRTSPGTPVAVGYVAQQEHPDHGQQESTGNEEESGVAHGEFQSGAEPGRLFMSTARVGGVRAGVDSVADAGHRGDEPWFAESFAQCGDGDADGVGEGVGVLVPGPLQ